MEPNGNRIVLPVGDLEGGTYEFDFRAGLDFFARYEGSEIRGGDVDINIEVQKAGSYMNIDIGFEGEVTVTCDRCLDDFEIPIEGNYLLSVRFTNNPPEYTDEDMYGEEDVMYAEPGIEELDMTDYVYESICLALPIQHIHPDDENGNSLCNPEMLKYLSSDNGKDSDSPFGILKDKI